MSSNTQIRNVVAASAIAAAIVGGGILIATSSAFIQLYNNFNKDQLHLPTRTLSHTPSPPAEPHYHP